ncbi:hypothetical protein [Paracoccus shanxieyensis]|nr:hypothetical protein [Paracoccus shanxieyensis]
MRMMTKIAAAGLATMIALPASAAITTREDNMAQPQGWSAVAGMDPREVREMARSLPPTTDVSPDKPWCDHRAQVEQSLTNEFGEARIGSNGGDTALWGSEQMGTWTVVLERADATSCIIASGTGFTTGANPSAYLTRVGLAR